MVLIIDSISVFIRSFFTDERPLNRPTWKSVLVPKRG
jgi:hypothetical protein